MPVSSRPGHRQIARPRRAAGEHDRVELGAQLVDRDVDADVRVGLEDDAFLHQQLQAPIEDALLELELRNAVAQQSADAIGALEHRDGVAGAIQLRGGREAGRARSRRRRRAGRCAISGGCGDDPAFVERAIDDRHLDRLDRDRIVVDAEHARAFARRRAQAAGELREVVRRVQPIDRRLPAIAIDEIVPVGDQVAERAAAVAERNAAVHAARGLILAAPASGYGR